MICLFSNLNFVKKILSKLKEKKTRYKELGKEIDHKKEEKSVIEENIQDVIEAKPVKTKKQTPREVQMNAPVFLNKYEKFEWLMKNGCTCEDDRAWFAEYKQSEEYRGLYET